MIKIGLCGTHGSGKSTKAKELADHFADLNKMVCVVDEVARSCPLSLRTVEAQEWIWREQCPRERDAMCLDVDVVICDRTMMGNLMYYRHIIETEVVSHQATLDRWSRWWSLYQIAIDWMHTYNQIIRLPLNLEWIKADVDDMLRPKDALYARRIDALFDQYVQPYVSDTFIYDDD